MEIYTLTLMQHDSPVLLDVQKSLGDARWVLPDAPMDDVAQIIQQHDLPEFIARLLCLRGVKPNEIDAFLNPTLRDHFPDPFTMAGMREFAEDIADAIVQGRKIAILADFDVDGATSAATLTRFLRACGQTDVPTYIPCRLSEGYGPSKDAFAALKEQGAEIVLVADCGITSFEPIKDAREMGLEVVVFDHHEPEEHLPDATHIINPKRADCAAGLETLAACGVCLLACVAINNVLKQRGFFKEKQLTPPDMKACLDLTALGTVCDMVPLLGANRLFVRAGFAQMARGIQNMGVQALFEVAGIDEVPRPDHAGWNLGPRINAGSRVYKSDLGAKLLSTDDAEEASAIAITLDQCNDERKEIQAEMTRRAFKLVEQSALEQGRVLVVDDPDGHPGLSGLVAGKLKERYGKPAVMITYADMPDGSREGRGSGRSVPGVNMAQMFIAAREAGILVKGGGHAMAGGFTILPDQVAALRTFLDAEVSAQLKNTFQQKDIVVDSLASVQGAQLDFIKLLETQMGPFGMGNPEPVFALSNVRVHMVDVLKDRHIRLQMSDWEGGNRMKAMFFGGVGTKLGDALLKQGKAQPLHFVGKFKLNCWQGRESVEFHVMDGVLVMADSAAA